MHFSTVLQGGPRWQPSRRWLTWGGTDQCEEKEQIPCRVQIPGRALAECLIFGRGRPREAHFMLALDNKIRHLWLSLLIQKSVA